MAGIKGQKHNPYIEGKYALVNKNDVVFTPDWLAEKIIVAILKYLDEQYEAENSAREQLLKE